VQQDPLDLDDFLIFKYSVGDSDDQGELVPISAQASTTQIKQIYTETKKHK